MPSQRLADFGGAGTPTCCAGINLNTDTFLLAQTDVCTLGYSDDCNASIPMTIGLNFFSTGLVVKIFHESDGSFIEFHKNYSALPNCMSESVGSIPYGTHNFGGVCGFSSNMTCSLSVP